MLSISPFTVWSRSGFGSPVHEVGWVSQAKASSRSVAATLLAQAAMAARASARQRDTGEDISIRQGLGGRRGCRSIRDRQFFQHLEHARRGFLRDPLLEKRLAFRQVQPGDEAKGMAFLIGLAGLGDLSESRGRPPRLS